jgi:hypothetical protein
MQTCAIFSLVTSSWYVYLPVTFVSANSVIVCLRRLTRVDAISADVVCIKEEDFTFNLLGEAGNDVDLGGTGASRLFRHHGLARRLDYAIQLSNELLHCFQSRVDASTGLDHFAFTDGNAGPVFRPLVDAGSANSTVH